MSLIPQQLSAQTVDSARYGYSPAEARRLNAEVRAFKITNANLESEIVRVSEEREIASETLWAVAHALEIEQPNLSAGVFVRELNKRAEVTAALRLELEELQLSIDYLTDDQLRTPAAELMRTAQAAIDNGDFLLAQNSLARLRRLRAFDLQDSGQAWVSAVEAEAHIAILQGRLELMDQLYLEADEFVNRSAVLQRWRFATKRAEGWYDNGSLEGKNSKILRAIKILNERALSLISERSWPVEWAETHSRLGQYHLTLGGLGNQPENLNVSSLHYDLATSVSHSLVGAESADRYRVGRISQAVVAGSLQLDLDSLRKAMTSFELVLQTEQTQKNPEFLFSTQLELLSLRGTVASFERKFSILEQTSADLAAIVDANSGNEDLNRARAFFYLSRMKSQLCSETRNVDFCVEAVQYADKLSESYSEPERVGTTLVAIYTASASTRLSQFIVSGDTEHYEGAEHFLANAIASSSESDFKSVPQALLFEFGHTLLYYSDSLKQSNPEWYWQKLRRVSSLIETHLAGRYSNTTAFDTLAGGTAIQLRLDLAIRDEDSKETANILDAFETFTVLERESQEQFVQAVNILQLGGALERAGRAFQREDWIAKSIDLLKDGLAVEFPDNAQAKMLKQSLAASLAGAYETRMLFTHDPQKSEALLLNAISTYRQYLIDEPSEGSPNPFWRENRLQFAVLLLRLARIQENTIPAEEAINLLPAEGQLGTDSSAVRLKIGLGFEKSRLFRFLSQEQSDIPLARESLQIASDALALAEASGNHSEQILLKFHHAHALLNIAALTNSNSDWDLALNVITRIEKQETTDALHKRAMFTLYRDLLAKGIATQRYGVTLQRIDAFDRMVETLPLQVTELDSSFALAMIFRYQLAKQGFGPGQLDRSIREARDFIARNSCSPDKEPSCPSVSRQFGLSLKLLAELTESGELLEEAVNYFGSYRSNTGGLSNLQLAQVSYEIGETSLKLGIARSDTDALCTAITEFNQAIAYGKLMEDDGMLEGVGDWTTANGVIRERIEKAFSAFDSLADHRKSNIRVCDLAARDQPAGRSVPIQ